MKAKACEHPFCWVNTKWGRYKGKPLLEIEYPGGEIKVQVLLLGRNFNKDEQIQEFNKDIIEYIISENEL